MAIGGIYQTGLITIQPDKLTVVGTGTLWGPIVEVGDWLFAQGQMNVVAAVDDDTHLTLEAEWIGTLPSASPYMLLKMSWLRYDPALTQAKVREFLFSIEATGIFNFVAGDEPDPELGENGQWALKVNSTPWQVWFKVDGVWNEQPPVGETGPPGPAGPAGPIGINWRGNWSAATAYAVRDAVYDPADGASYIAVIANTNSNPPSANWNSIAAGTPGPAGPAGPAGPVGIVWRGTWSSATTYAINDAVVLSGTSYIAIAANTNSMPPSANWSVLAQGGTAVIADDTILPQHLDADTAPKQLLFRDRLNFISRAGDTATGDIRIARGASPVFSVERTDAHGAALAQVGQYDFLGRNSSAAAVRYAGITARVQDNTTGSEDAFIEFMARLAGVETTFLQLGKGGSVWFGTNEIIRADTTRFVGSGGSDASDGLTPATRWLTLQKAADAIAKMMIPSGVLVTIDVANGTYAGGAGATLCSINGWSGGGRVMFDGDSATPSNVVLTASNNNVFRVTPTGANLGGGLVLRGFRLSGGGGTGGVCVRTAGRGIVEVTTCEYFGANVIGLFTEHFEAVLRVVGNQAIAASSSWDKFLDADAGVIQLDPATITVGTGINVTTAFAVARFKGYMLSQATFSPAGGGANVSGLRYQVREHGAIDTQEAGENYFPGNAAGTRDGGGTYDGRGATQANMEAEDANTYVNPLMQRHHPGHPKAWAFVSSAGALQSGYGVSGASRVSTGVYTVTMSPQMANTNYAVFANQEDLPAGAIRTVRQNTATVNIHTFNSSNAAADSTFFCAVFGDQ